MPPVLSLLEDKLTEVGDADASGHKVVKVTFEEKGITKRGFFKHCDNDKYPPLLAKYVVAFSVFVRAALGAKASEERLVYNNLGDIVGTVSIEVPNFIPLLPYWLGKDYKDEEEKKLGNPDKQKLIDTNVAELLISAYKHQNDDLHPDNISLNGLIDWDELYRKLTWILKGKRPGSGWVIESPDKVNYITEQDLRTFPIIASRIHWPAHPRPKNGNPLKLFLTNAFIDIVNDPDLYPQFRHQYFTAILKELLAYDDKMLKERMRDYLGDEGLDLGLLPHKKRERLLKYGESRKLFYDKKGNERNFVDQCSIFFESEHQYFKNIVLKMPEFREFLLTLNKNPTEVFDLKNWFEKNNANNPIPYNLAYINQQYHAIWRDSFNTLFDKHLQDLQNVIILSKDPDPDGMEKADPQEYKLEKVDLLVNQLITAEQEEKHKKTFIKRNEKTKRHERKVLTDVVIFQLRKKAKDLYRNLSFCKNNYFAKLDLVIKDNHDFTNEMTAFFKKTAEDKVVFKKWLLEIREKLKHTKDIDFLMDNLIFEMNHLFSGIDQITAGFLETLTSFRMDPIVEPLIKEKFLDRKPQEAPIKPRFDHDKLLFEFKDEKEHSQSEKLSQSVGDSLMNPLPLVPLTEDLDSDDKHDHVSDSKESKILPDEKVIITTISRLLAAWIPTVDDSAIKKLVLSTRLREYDPKNKGYVFGWVYSKTLSKRGDEVDNMPLNEIFKSGKWNSTSLNTYIVKNLCLKMAYECTDDDPKVQPILEKIQMMEKDQNWWGSVANTIAKKSGLKDISESPEQASASPSQARLV